MAMQTVNFFSIRDFLTDDQVGNIVWDSFTFGDAAMTLVPASQVCFEIEANEVEIPEALESLAPDTLIAFDG